MASLQNEQIDQSYQGLIKTADNTSAKPFPPAKLQYGDGTDTPIAIGEGPAGSGLGEMIEITSGAGTNTGILVNGTGVVVNDLNNISPNANGLTIANGGAATTINFGYGFPGAPVTTVDFTNATVSGLPGGAAGLENGTGADSLQSAAALTTNAADASGAGSIAIGDGAEATRQESVAIGQGAEANGTGSEGSIAIGHGSVASSNRGIAIGINGTTNSSEGIVIGDNVDISGSDRSVAIGGAISISGGNDKIAIGTSASVAGQRGLAFGQNASATANEAIAIGYNVTAANAQTLSVNALETQADSTPTAGGIIMSDAGGTDRRINIDASGALQIDSTPVGGGGGTAGLEVGTGTNSLQNAVGSASTASGAQSIALGAGATASGGQSMAYGDQAQATQTSAASFGQYAEATATYAIAFGRTSAASGDGAVAFGQQTSAAQAGAVAMGRQVTSDTADTTHVRALKIVAPDGGTGGNGITMLSPNGTAGVVTLNNDSKLAVDGNVVGAATQFELAPFTVPANAASDICYAVVTIPANTFGDGDILEFRALEKRDSLNNTVYESYWFSEQSQTVGSAVQTGTAYQQAGLQDSANGTTYYQKTLYISSSGTTVSPYGRTNDTSIGTVEGGDPVETQSVDWTKTQYFFYQGWSDATAGTVQNFGTILRKIN